MNLTNREMYDRDQVAEWRRKAAALDKIAELLLQTNISIRQNYGEVRFFYYDNTAQRWVELRGSTLLTAIEPLGL